MVSATAFQAEDVSSILITRSKLKNHTAIILICIVLVYINLILVINGGCSSVG